MNIFNASTMATNTSVEVNEFQDYWDQLPSFQLADSFYKHQMKYFDPSDDPDTANFTITSPEKSRENPQAAASSDQVSLPPMFLFRTRVNKRILGQRILVRACDPSGKF
jgi:hypothetical protein